MPSCWPASPSAAADHRGGQRRDQGCAAVLDRRRLARARHPLAPGRCAGAGAGNAGVGSSPPVALARLGEGEPEMGARVGDVCVKKPGERGLRLSRHPRSSGAGRGRAATTAHSSGGVMSSTHVAQDARACGDAPAGARVLFVHPSDELYGSDLSLLNMLRGLDRAASSRWSRSPMMWRTRARSAASWRRRPSSAAIWIWQWRGGSISRRWAWPAFCAACAPPVACSPALSVTSTSSVVHTNTLAVWSGALAARRAGRPHTGISRSSSSGRGRCGSSCNASCRHTRACGRCLAGGAGLILVTPEARAKSSVIYNAVAPEPWMAAAGRERIRVELGWGRMTCCWGWWRASRA